MDPRYKSPETGVLLNDSDDFRDLGSHTTLLVWLLRIGAVFAMLVVWSNWMQLEMLARQYTLEEAQANDLRERSLTISALVVSLVCYVIFGRWIVLAQRNIRPLGTVDPEFTPGWAVGWFFIPFANLWKPYQAMRQLWQASDEVRDYTRQPVHPLLVTWWTLWIISSLFGSYLFRASGHFETVAEIEVSTRALLINSAIDIPQYIVAWLMVQKIWEAQAAQRRRQLAAMRPTDLSDVTPLA